MLYPLVVPVARQGCSPHAAVKRRIKLIVVDHRGAPERAVAEVVRAAA
jgi:hypothetical protein